MVTLNEVLERVNGYIVGGAVRDKLLGLKPKDYDVCTHILPEAVWQMFTGHCYIVGEKFGTVGVHTTDVGDVEITTMRKEVIPGRKPVVKWTTNLEEDLSRRDYTINAMALDIDGNLIDPFGGAADLFAGILRAVGDANERIREDPLRIMRGVRFIVKYNLQPQSDLTEALCFNTLDGLSKERIRDEFMKILEVNPVYGLKWLKYIGVIKEMSPMIDSYSHFDQNPIFHPELDVWNHTLLGIEDGFKKGFPVLSILAHLLHDCGKPETWDGCHYNGHDQIGAKFAEEFMRRFCFSNADIDAVVFAVKNHMKVCKWDEMRTGKKIKIAQDSNLTTLLHVHEMDSVGRPLKECSVDAILEFKSNIKEKVNCYLNGFEIMAQLELPPGPGVGYILNHLIELQVEGKINDRDEAIKYLATEFDWKVTNDI
jgi:tRNA nucleotidyltransferase (CCA-adding enzyme)